jgi:hypothetical protein
MRECDHNFFQELILSIEMSLGAQVAIEERVFEVAGKYLLMELKYISGSW